MSDSRSPGRSDDELADSCSPESMGRRGFLRLWAEAGLVAGAPALIAGCQNERRARKTSMRALDPDNEPDSIVSARLAERLGPVPKPSRAYQVGAVVKFLGNEYWKLLADGMQSRADRYGITLDVQGAATESDRTGQQSIMDGMVERRYDALLVSPQTDENLAAAVEKARNAGIVVVNVDDAVLKDAEHFVGPLQYENGIRAAKYIRQRVPGGGKVAVIEGQAGVYAAKQRTKGFVDTMAGTKFTVVASETGDWDLKKSLQVAGAILKQHPDIRGFYCNNDIMALGVAEAVNSAGRRGKIIVIGTDGIKPAYDAIRAGELTGTVDSFPFATGQVAMDVALRLLGRQNVPRVVFSPQNLVTKDNVDRPLPG